MRLLIDLQGAIGSNRMRELGRYSWQLGRELAAREDLDVEFLLQGSTDARTLIRFRDQVRHEAPRAEVITYLAPWPWLQGDPLSASDHRQAEIVRDLAIASRRPDAVLVVSPFESARESVVSVAHERGYVVAAVGYDLLALTRPDCAPPAEEAELYRRRLRSVAECDVVLASSDHTRAEFERLGVKAETIWGAARPLPRPEQHGMRRPQGIVCAGGEHPRKNVVSTIRAFATIGAELQSRHPLTILGNYSASSRQEFLALARDLSIPADRVRIPGEIRDDVLARIYAEARVVVMPSLGEGLGLPVLQAWEQGAAVLASESTSLGEVVADRRFTFDPSDVGQQAEAIRRILADEQFFAAACEYGAQRVRDFTWRATADRAATALVRAVERRKGAAQPKVQPARPRLALVTPWPPDASGIAGHAQRLAPELARHYDVVVVPETDAGWRAATDAGWETAAAADVAEGRQRFHRVLYNIGNNSNFHRRALYLSESVPGVFLAHEVNLRGLLTGASRLSAQESEARAYLERGIAVVGDPQAPVGLSLLRTGLGVICHSEAARTQIAGTSRVPDGPPVSVVPLVLIRDTAIDQSEAKAALGLPLDSVLIATFGAVAPNRGVDLLLDACAEGFVGPEVVIAVVGRIDEDYLGRLRHAAESPVVFTGGLDDEAYEVWLAAADIAVQLRPTSRGEASGAAIEALAHGCAVVVDSRSSMAELDSVGVIVIPAPVQEATLHQELQRLVGDAQGRESIQRRCREQARSRHEASAVAPRIVEFIESCYARPWIPQPPRALSDTALASVAVNSERRAPAILMDASRLAFNSERTGSERVTLRLARELAGVSGSNTYLIAARDRLEHTPELLDVLEGRSRFGPGWTWSKEHITVPGDVFLSAELMLDNETWRMGVLDFKAHGGRFVQVVHDILPTQLPEFFVTGVKESFESWLHFILEAADLVLCDSRATLDALASWSQRMHPSPVPMRLIRLGFDLAEPPVSPIVRRRARGQRRVLTVGTIEPRKGVEVLMDAAEELWSRGEDVEFVVVGRAGWAGTRVLDRLSRLTASDRPLNWYQGMDDGWLSWEYLNADLLVTPSRAEGFGLPIVEALSHGVPVVARDIPVFRELLGDKGDYFKLDDELADVILRRLRSDKPPAFVPECLVSWRETAGDVLIALGRPRPAKASA